MDESLLMLPDMDIAILGVCETWDNGNRVKRIVYDASVVIDILIEDHSMDPDEAYEYVLFNIQDAYVGLHTPILVWRLEPWEIESEHTESIWAPRDGEDYVPFKSGRVRARSEDRAHEDRLLRLHQEGGIRGQRTGRQALSALERRERFSVVSNPALTRVPLPGHDRQRDDEGSKL